MLQPRLIHFDFDVARNMTIDDDFEDDEKWRYSTLVFGIARNVTQGFLDFENGEKVGVVDTLNLFFFHFDLDQGGIGNIRRGTPLGQGALVYYFFYDFFSVFF